MSRRDALENLAALVRLANDLNPSALASKVSEYTRGGFPRGGFRDGSRGSERPLPVNDRGEAGDRTDRSLVKGQKQYDWHIFEARRHLEWSLRFQNSVLIVAERNADPTPTPCPNLVCAGTLEEGRTKGECQKCRVHRRRWGLAWPQKP